MKKMIFSMLNCTFILLLMLTVTVQPVYADRVVIQTIRVSVASGGVQVMNDGSYNPSVSADGRYVVFESSANDLVPGDNNTVSDIFRHDSSTKITTRLSVSSEGEQADDDSYYPSISADGRYVAFHSEASNLVAGDTNDAYDVFLHDCVNHTTIRVSLSSDEDEITLGHVAWYADISPDGNFVVFASDEDDLVIGDGNGHQDIFLRDVAAGTTEIISISNVVGEVSNGISHSPSVSNNGLFVAFTSSATNLVSVDTNLVEDVFVHDVTTHVTSLVSVSSGGVQGNYQSGNASPASISEDGTVIAFTSDATNLVDGDDEGQKDVFVRDCTTPTTIRVSENASGAGGNGLSRNPSISGNGLLVAFESYAPNLVASDTNDSYDIFAVDLDAVTINRVSVNSSYEQADAGSRSPDVSGDGSAVVFSSSASNLVSDDTNGYNDVFLKKSYSLDHSFYFPLFSY